MSTILVVDDDPISRSVVRRMLQNLGHAVLEAADGATATSLYKESLPDLILLDIVMPGKDGFETLIDIRSLHAQAKAIMMTASRGISVELQSQLGGFLSIPPLLLKPIDSQTLGRVVAEALANSATDGSANLELDARN